MTDFWQQHTPKNTISKEITDNSFVALSSQRFISIEGPDAKQFLQGQLSCDLNAISLELSSLGSHCNAKGRMQSSFRIFQTGEQSFQLMLHHSISEQALAALKKYSIFSKATLELNDNLAFAVFGKEPENALTTAINARELYAQQSFGELTLVNVCTKTPAYLVFGKPDAVKAKAEELSQNLTLQSESQWQLLQHQQGLAFVENATFDAFIPQQFNYQHTPAISFTKGCYTGQEIVARMHYLGKTKRAMYRFKINTSATIEVGSVLDSLEGKAAQGHIVSFVNQGDNNFDVLVNTTEALATSKTWQHNGKDIEVLEAITLIDEPQDTNQ